MYGKSRAFAIPQANLACSQATEQTEEQATEATDLTQVVFYSNNRSDRAVRLN